MSTDNETLIKALRILARDIVSDDGVANACVDEAAARIEELAGEIHSCPVCLCNCKECECTEKQIESLKAENEQLKLAKAELVDVLAGVKDRLDYLIDLLGNEGVTNRVVQSINAALAKHGRGQ